MGSFSERLAPQRAGIWAGIRLKGREAKDKLGEHITNSKRVTDSLSSKNLITAEQGLMGNIMLYIRATRLALTASSLY